MPRDKQEKKRKMNKKKNNKMQNKAKKEESEREKRVDERRPFEHCGQLMNHFYRFFHYNAIVFYTLWVLAMVALQNVVTIVCSPNDLSAH